MTTASRLRIEPPATLLEASRRWLEPVRAALGHDYLAAYLSGSVLTQGFDPRRSRVNVLVVARELGPDTLDALATAIPVTRRAPHFDPLFLTRRQIAKSLDAFPIEWLEIQERHLRLEGEDVFGDLEVPRAALRLQCEHELRSKHLQLRQTYLASARQPARLRESLAASASGFAALFRTLLRLRGESPDANTAHVVESVAATYGLDAQGLLGAHLVRTSERRWRADEVRPLYRRFLVEVDRLVQAIDELRLP